MILIMFVDYYYYFNIKYFYDMFYHFMLNIVLLGRYVYGSFNFGDAFFS